MAGIFIRYLTIAGLALGMIVTALAQDIGPTSPPASATRTEGMNDTPTPEDTDKHPEVRQHWENTTPREREARRKAMREHWESMTPQEREARRKAMREHWESMTPQEREARRKAMREHWKNMTPQERDRLRRDMDKQDHK